MYEIEFYQTSSGKELITEYIIKLQEVDKKKDSRIRLKKIFEYLDYLAKYGTRIGEPIVKHLDQQIWELRPSNDRILFFYWKDNRFVMLHHFIKKTEKTPKREIEQAKRNMKDHMERCD